MKINFYEEFPTKKNLQKLKQVKFPTKLFLAAPSVDKYLKLKQQAEKIKKNIKTAYWPIVKNSYWISPFSNSIDLDNLFKELENHKGEILIDLELPLLNKKLFLKNFFKFPKNKKMIKKFIEKNKDRITTAQSPFQGKIIRRIRQFFGWDFDINCEKSFMFYTSTLRSMHLGFLIKQVEKSLEKIKNKKRCSIGLGVLAKGVFSENILTPSQLEQNLKFVKKAGFQKVVLFRLGGLNKKYLDILKKFID
jgi:hypothetical protein